MWRDGDITSPPARGIQTILVPPGGCTIVEYDAIVPGSYTLVDHAIFRVDKGAVVFIKVLPNINDKNYKRSDIYGSAELPVLCPGCKLHN